MAQLMVVLDSTVVNVALPDATKALRITTANRQWVITAYALAFGSLLLLGGRIADYWGRKRSFILGMVGLAAASAIGGLARTSGMLFGARALQGMFAALLAPAALALLSVTFEAGKERSSAFAVYGAVSAVGGAVGLVLGGALTESASWRWCLLVNIPIALISIAAAVPILTESRAFGDTRYDIPGALAATAGIASLVFGFTKAGEHGWSSSSAILFMAIGAAILALFVVIESRATNALLPLRILLDRTRGAAFLVSMLVGAGVFSSTLYLTFFMQTILHFSPLQAGPATLPITATIIVAAGFAGPMLPKLGPRLFLGLGALVSAAGVGWLATLDEHSTFLGAILGANLVFGLGIGLVMTCVPNIATHGVGHHDAGAAGATVNATQQVGGALGVALVGSFFTRAISNYLADHGNSAKSSATQLHAQVHGYVLSFEVSAGILVLAAVVVAFLVTGGGTATAEGESAHAVDAQPAPYEVEPVPATIEHGLPS